MLVPYFYAFFTLPGDVRGVWNVMNVQDEEAASKPVFGTRILESARLNGLVRKASVRERLSVAAASQHIEVKAEEFGPALENARKDYSTEEGGAFLMQIVIDELYRDLGFLRPPVITAKIVERAGLTNITWNQNFKALFAKLGPNLEFHPGIPLAGAARSARTLWSAATLGADLYVGAPLSEYVRAKLSEGSVAARAQGIVEELVTRAEFPNVRRLVLSGRIGPREVLELRRHAARFRKWLSSEKSLERDAVLAYLGQIASDAGWRKELGTVIGVLGMAGGVVSGVLSAPVLGPLGGAIAGVGTQFVLDVGRRVVEGWKPVVFGNFARARIERALGEDG